MYNNQFGYNPYYQPMLSTTGQQFGGQVGGQVSGQVNTTQMTTQPRATLNGKLVDSIEVAKNSEYPLDGSVSYFVLTNGSAIVTKQLMQDGTSKTLVYKPVVEQKNEVKYLTQDDMKKAIDELDLSQIDDLKDDIKDLRQEFKDLKKNIKKEG